MNEGRTDSSLAWLQDWQGRAEGHWLTLALDLFEPFAPLGAQILYLAQPTMGWMMGHTQIAALAHALETPEGVAAVRDWLKPDAERTDKTE